jgi:ribonuclease P protein component
MSGLPEDYGRHRRIVRTDEFSSVFRLRPTFRTENFVLYVRPNELGHARLGVVIAKRFAPRAVTRNLAKRLSREIFRKTGLKAVDCIVRLNKPLISREQSASSRLLKKLLGAELTRLLQSQRAHPQ